MALVACKECGNEISDKAKSCPKCGAKPKRTSFLVKFLLVIFGLATLGQVIGASGGRSSSANSQTSEHAAAKSEQDVVFQRASIGALSLRKAMRNPDSFKLESAIVTDARAVCYEYRAQNGFGGTNVEHAVLASDGKTLKSESMAGFNNLWKKECNNKQGEDYTGRVKVALNFQP